VIGEFTAGEYGINAGYSRQIDSNLTGQERILKFITVQFVFMEGERPSAADSLPQNFATFG
jgi:hypothetical protein